MRLQDIKYWHARGPARHVVWDSSLAMMCGQVRTQPSSMCGDRDVQAFLPMHSALPPRAQSQHTCQILSYSPPCWHQKGPLYVIQQNLKKLFQSIQLTKLTLGVRLKLSFHHLCWSVKAAQSKQVLFCVWETYEASMIYVSLEGAPVSDEKQSVHQRDPSVETLFLEVFWSCRQLVPVCQL